MFIVVKNLHYKLLFIEAVLWGTAASYLKHIFWCVLKGYCIKACKGYDIVVHKLVNVQIFIYNFKSKSLCKVVKLAAIKIMAINLDVD